MHEGEEGHARPGWTTSRRGQDSPWNCQSEWQRTGINGESTSMVWPTLGSRTAKEQNRTNFQFLTHPVTWPGLDRFSTANRCEGKSKGKGKRSIAVRKKPHRYGNSRTIWDHTVLPATRQRWYSRLHPSRSWYSIKRFRRDARLSWPSWLVTARDGILARRRSPIPVVTGPDVR